MKPRYDWTRPNEELVTGKGQVLRHLLVSGGIWSLCFKMIRTEIIRLALAEAEDFYCTMGEDLYFYLLTAYHAEKLRAVSRPYYNYDTGSGITAHQNVSPEKFKTYFKALVNNVRTYYPTDMIFVFAWNEWAEGGYLEPDEKWGYGMLEGIRAALQEE